MSLRGPAMAAGVVALLACGRAPLAEPPGRAAARSAATQDHCPLQKLGFTRETGCENDGSVELCVASGDAALQSRVRHLAPSLIAKLGSGRAACDRGRETLFFYPTREEDPSVCTSRHGALTDRAWGELCALAALPEIRRIVPTWYE